MNEIPEVQEMPSILDMSDKDSSSLVKSAEPSPIKQSPMIQDFSLPIHPMEMVEPVETIDFIDMEQGEPLPQTLHV